MPPLSASLKRCASIEPVLRTGAHQHLSYLLPSSHGVRNISSFSTTTTTSKMAGRHPTDDYTKWTKDSLIARLRKVESELKKRPARTPSPVPHHHHPPPEPKKQRKGTTQPKLDPSDYNTRYVAFKLAYLGRNYGGFEFASSGSLPSVEEELFKALTRACLIFPKDERVVDFSGLDYSKCGRTDRGVSAFGQVIALRVKSARPVPGRAARKRKEKAEAKAEAARAAGEEPLPQEDDAAAAAAAAEEAERRPFDPINDELPYCKMLNRILPRDIRILAWCPSPPPDFSARFSCRGREYRYFFTQPAFHPPTTGGAADDGQPHPGWLDIDAMRDAARRFEGDHDFRNFCKVDPAKNVLSYRRKIMESAIYEADDMSSHMPHLAGAPAGHAGGGPYPKVYYFKVRGTAFLWHQIRHMVSILFHVGQGLESPDLVDKLLDTETNPRRPTYTMADEIPLVLWDCTFPEVEWRHADADIEAGKASASFGALDGMWRLWREVKMDEILANGLMRITAGADDGAVKPPSSRTVQSKKKQGEYSMRRFEGGNGPRLVGTYKPVMDMLRMGTPQEQNDKFAQRKGFATHEEMLKDRWEKREERNGQSGGE